MFLNRDNRHSFLQAPVRTSFKKVHDKYRLVAQCGTVITAYTTGVMSEANSRYTAVFSSTGEMRPQVGFMLKMLENQARSTSKADLDSVSRLKLEFGESGEIEIKGANMVDEMLLFSGDYIAESSIDICSRNIGCVEIHRFDGEELKLVFAASVKIGKNSFKDYYPDHIPELIQKISNQVLEKNLVSISKGLS